MTVTICASTDFYKTVIDIGKDLKNLGHKVLLPKAATQMQKDKNFSLRDYYKNHHGTNTLKAKRNLIGVHFSKVAKSDAILVVNLRKKGVNGYIGGNVLMEMGIAFYLKKKIYVLHPVLKKLPLSDEIFAMNPVFLDGDLKKIS